MREHRERGEKRSHRDSGRRSRTVDADMEDGEAAPAPKDIDFMGDISAEEMQMMMAMGIPFGFDTTQGKHVEDDKANVGAVKVKSKRSARQYMNRKGGFNRPLPAEKTGEKVIRD